MLDTLIGLALIFRDIRSLPYRFTGAGSDSVDARGTRSIGSRRSVETRRNDGVFAKVEICWNPPEDKEYAKLLNTFLDLIEQQGFLSDNAQLFSLQDVPTPAMLADSLESVSETTDSISTSTSWPDFPSVVLRTMTTNMSCCC